MKSCFDYYLMTLNSFMWLWRYHFEEDDFFYYLLIAPLLFSIHYSKPFFLVSLFCSCIKVFVKDAKMFLNMLRFLISLNVSYIWICFCYFLMIYFRGWLWQPIQEKYIYSERKVNINYTIQRFGVVFYLILKVSYAHQGYSFLLNKKPQ